MAKNHTEVTIMQKITSDDLSDLVHVGNHYKAYLKATHFDVILACKNTTFRNNVIGLELERERAFDETYKKVVKIFTHQYDDSVIVPPVSDMEKRILKDAFEQVILNVKNKLERLGVAYGYNNELQIEGKKIISHYEELQAKIQGFI